MEAIGIIGEFNPFHNGHKYLIDKAKEMFPHDIIVLILNSSFMQRGDISIINKWDKTTLALNNGVDLVIELPFFYGSQSADIFAKGAIEILKDLKVSKMIFGSETNNIDFLFKMANIELNDQRFSPLVKEYLSKGENYPTALAKTIKDLSGLIISKPNDLLALSYIKEIIRQKASIKPISIQRTNDYHDLTIEENTSIVSASNIRNLIKQGKDITNYIPKETKKYLRNIDEQLLWNLLRFQLINNLATLDKFQTVDEGIDNKIRKYLNTCESLQEFKEKIKTKRYTYNKINRMIIHLLTNFTKEEVCSIKKISYIRLLGFNSLGKEYLNKIKKEINLPLITRSLQKDDPLLNLEYRATYIYSLITKDPSLIKKELENKPIIL